jgi:hypothetical protein
LGDKTTKTKNNMAIVTDSDVVFSQVPPYMRNKYVLRVKEAVFAPSSKGNPMVTLRCEIVKPETVVIQGRTYALDSLEVNYWFPIKVYDERTGEVLVPETKKAQGKYKDFLKKLELPSDFDDENPDISEFQKGLMFSAMLDSREKVAQRRGEDGKYEQLKDDDGKKISLGWEVVANGSDVIRRYTGDVDRAY